MRFDHRLSLKRHPSSFSGWDGHVTCLGCHVTSQMSEYECIGQQTASNFYQKSKACGQVYVTIIVTLYWKILLSGSSLKDFV